MRSSFATCSPKGPNDHLGIIEGVIEVTAEPLKIETPKSGVFGLRVEGTGTRQDGDNANSFAEFGGEQVRDSRSSRTTKSAHGRRDVAPWR